MVDIEGLSNGSYHFLLVKDNKSIASQEITILR
jgi:hypothetical protein